MNKNLIGRSLAGGLVIAFGYTVWMYLEESRVLRADWAEVTDPVEFSQE